MTAMDYIEQERDQKLEEIAREILGVSLKLGLSPTQERITVFLIDLKMALQIAYQAGADSMLGGK